MGYESCLVGKDSCSEYISSYVYENCGRIKLPIVLDSICQSCRKGYLANLYNSDEHLSTNYSHH